MQTKYFARQLLIHHNVDISQNVNWRVMVIISLKMRNPECESFFESGFSVGNDSNDHQFQFQFHVLNSTTYNLSSNYEYIANKYNSKK